MTSLREMYKQHRGMLSDKWASYLREYHRLFSPYRDQPLSLLEIGVQNGGSLEIWSDYFPNAKLILGCDINPACAGLNFSSGRIVVEVGDANTDRTEQKICRHASNFDLIIDDGSHTSADIVKSFARYFPRLRQGGLYVVEDLHCSYWRDYEGGINYPFSSIEFFKSLADIINFEHWGVGSARHDLLIPYKNHFSVTFADSLLAQVHSLEFINSMCVIRKQAATANRLGRRFIAGQEELVQFGHLSLHGRPLSVPDQRTNPWAIVEDKSIVHLVELRQSIEACEGRLNDQLDHSRSKLEGLDASCGDRFTLIQHRLQAIEEYFTDQYGQAWSRIEEREARDWNHVLDLEQNLKQRESWLEQRMGQLQQTIAGWEAHLTAREELEGQRTQLLVELKKAHGELALLAQTNADLVMELADQRIHMMGELNKAREELAVLAQAKVDLVQELEAERLEKANSKEVVTLANGKTNEMSQALAETSACLGAVELRLVLAEAENRRLGSHNLGLEGALVALRSSLSWRLTAPLRAMGHASLRLGRYYRLSRGVFRLGGGIRGTLALTVRVMKTEGLDGISWRLDNAARLMDQAGIPPRLNAEGGSASAVTEEGLDPITPAELTDYREWKNTVLEGAVDIIVCVHDALDDVKKCLSSVIRYSLPPCRLIVVDDGSNEETRNYLEVFCSQQGATLIRNDEAKGYTFAANQGLRYATGLYVVLLNSDTLVTLGWIEKMVRCAQSDKRIGLVGPLSNTASWQSIPELRTGEDWAENPLPQGLTLSEMSNYLARYSPRRYPRLAFLNGFCLLIKRAVITDIGLFDEDVFGQGYGEENDYCLRACLAGWSLAVADDAYVFHAQSKSYSHDKRMELVRRSDQALAIKHDGGLIARGVARCQENLVLMSARAHARWFAWRKEICQQGLSRWEGRRVLFVLPVMHAGGGANVVITEARAMRAMGVSVALVNLESFRTAFTRSYPQLDIPVIFVADPGGIALVATAFDAVVATANQSVEWIKPLIKDPGTAIVLGYYIQDYEPYFFEEGTDSHRIAVASYRIGDALKLFTKTSWNAEVLWRELGVSAPVVGASYDADLFRPFDEPSLLPISRGHLTITAMVRPSTPRRNPEGTMRILYALKKRYGERISIEIFGAEADGPPIPAPAQNFDYVNHGQIFGKALIRLFSRTDIFVDMSDYQAMGLTAMEAMACGAVPVVPIKGGAASFAIAGRNALMVPTDDEVEVVKVITALIEDPARLRPLRINAINDIARFLPEGPAFKILEHLFG